MLGSGGASRTKAIESGMELVRAKRGWDGMWKMVGGLNGRMHANLDRKGKGSPWITYWALLAFKLFDALEMPVEV